MGKLREVQKGEVFLQEHCAKVRKTRDACV